MTDEEVRAFDALRTRTEAASAAIDGEAALMADGAHIGITSSIGPIVTDMVRCVTGGKREHGGKYRLRPVAGQTNQRWVSEVPTRIILRSLQVSGLQKATPVDPITLCGEANATTFCVWHGWQCLVRHVAAVSGSTTGTSYRLVGRIAHQPSVASGKSPGVH